MIHDEKAEKLESRGLYRRAAARWGEVMMQVEGDKEREEIAKRRAECIHKAARPRQKAEAPEGLKKAINRTYNQMGLQRPHGGTFSNYQNQS
ncbi:PerC family transcriptional regulator [Escherichia coli]